MPRTYTEREIAALLARAAEKQRAAPSDDGSPGLSLDEVLRAAAEAGIDPAHVRAAAAEIDAGAFAVAAPAPRPGAVALERWAGAPLTDASWEEAVHVLRARYGPSTSETGAAAAGPDVTRVGGAYEWTHQTFGGLQTVVSVSPRGERTRLRLSQTEWGAVGDRATAAIYAGMASAALAVVAAVLAVVASGSGTVVWLVALMVVAVGTWGGGVLATPAVRRSRARRAAKAAEALDAVAQCVEAAVADAPLAAGTSDIVTPLLDLDALPDPLDSAGGGSGRQRTGS